MKLRSDEEPTLLQIARVRASDRRVLDAGDKALGRVTEAVAACVLVLIGFGLIEPEWWVVVLLTVPLWVPAGLFLLYAALRAYGFVRYRI